MHSQKQTPSADVVSDADVDTIVRMNEHVDTDILQEPADRIEGPKMTRMSKGKERERPPADLMVNHSNQVEMDVLYQAAPTTAFIHGEDTADVDVEIEEDPAKGGVNFCSFLLLRSIDSHLQITVDF